MVMCDFACTGLQNVDLSGCELVTVKQPCIKASFNPDKFNGKPVIFAGCMLLEKNGFYGKVIEALSLTPGDYIISNIKEEIVDRYGKDAVIKENLQKKIDSLITILSAKEKIKSSGAKPYSNVLVYGSGYSGLNAAIALADRQVNVDIIETPGESISPGLLSLLLENPGIPEKLRVKAEENKQIFFVSSSYLYSFVPGSSGYTLKGDIDASYGAIVFAPERSEQPCREKGAYNMTGFYKKLAEGAIPVSARIVYVLDYYTKLTPEVFRDVLVSAVYLVRNKYADITILFRESQVSFPGGEDLYTNARQAGIVFIKYEDISVWNDFGDFTITGTDTQVRQNFVFSKPDYAVFAEISGLDPAALRFAELLKIDTTGGCFNQPDSQWVLPNETGRYAVFASGSARGFMIPGDVQEDAMRLAVAVSGRLGIKKQVIEEHIPVVNTDKCVYCLTCVRVCPFGAMTKDTDKNVARVIPEACRTCGICASECPAEAIQVRNMKTDTLVEAVTALIGNT